MSVQIKETFLSKDWVEFGDNFTSGSEIEIRTALSEKLNSSESEKEKLDFVSSCFKEQGTKDAQISETKSTDIENQAYHDTKTFKTKWIALFCDSEWDMSSFSKIATMFNDILLSKEQHSLIITKIISNLSKVSFDELPSLIYQTLLLSRNYKEIRIISSIIFTFDNLEKSISSDTDSNNNNAVYDKKKLLKEIEGTILLHITFCTQQDHEWGTQIFKFAKKGQRKKFGGYSSLTETVSPFFLALVLSIGAIPKFKDSAFEWFRTLIMSFSRDFVKINRDSWGRVSSKKTFGEKESKHASNLCSETIESLIMNMFLCLEENQPSGSVLLNAVFNSSCINSQLFVSQEKLFSSSLESLLNFPEKERRRILFIMKPLLENSPKFFNGFVLILRKALYSRAYLFQKASVLVIMDLIQLFTVSTKYYLMVYGQYETKSLVFEDSEDVLCNSNSKHNSVILFELVGLLRRSFMYQSEILSLSLSKISSLELQIEAHDNDSLLESVSRMLYVEFQKFYDNSSALSPFNLRKSLSRDFKLVYPLSTLYLSFHKVIFSLGSTISNSSWFLKGLEIFIDITTRLLKTDFEDIGLDLETGFEFENISSLFNTTNSLNSGKIINSYLLKQYVECIDASLELILILNIKKPSLSVIGSDLISKHMDQLGSKIFQELILKRSSIIKKFNDNFVKSKSLRSGNNFGFNSDKSQMKIFCNCMTTNSWLSTSFLMSLNTVSSDNQSSPAINSEYSLCLLPYIINTGYVYSQFLGIKLNYNSHNSDYEQFFNDVSKSVPSVGFLIVTTQNYIKTIASDSQISLSNKDVIAFYELLSTLISCTVFQFLEYFSLNTERAQSRNDVQESIIKKNYANLFEKTPRKTIIQAVSEIIQSLNTISSNKVEVPVKLFYETLNVDESIFPEFKDAYEILKPNAFDFLVFLVVYKWKTSNYINSGSINWVERWKSDIKESNTNDRNIQRLIGLLSIYSQSLEVFGYIIKLIHVECIDKKANLGHVLKCLPPFLSLAKTICFKIKKLIRQIFKCAPSNFVSHEFNRSIENYNVFCNSVFELVFKKSSNDLESEANGNYLNANTNGHDEPTIVKSILSLYNEIIYVGGTNSNSSIPAFWGIDKQMGDESITAGLQTSLDILHKVWKNQISNLNFWAQIGKDISVLFSNDSTPSQNSNSGDDPSISVVFAIVNYKTSDAVISLAFSFADSIILDCEFMILQLLKAVDYDVENFESLEVHAIHLEQRICEQLKAVCTILCSFMQSLLPQAHIEALYKTMISLYRCFSLLLSSKIQCISFSFQKSEANNLENNKDDNVFGLPVTDGFISLISFIGSSLNPLMFILLNSSLQFDPDEVSAEAEAKDIMENPKSKFGSQKSLASKSSNVSKKNKIFNQAARRKSLKILTKASSRVKRESRLIPQLIYLQERCEHYVMALGSKAKISLIHYFKRDVARDFKINASSIGLNSQNLLNSQRAFSQNSQTVNSINPNNAAEAEKVIGQHENIEDEVLENSSSSEEIIQSESDNESFGSRAISSKRKKLSLVPPSSSSDYSSNEQEPDENEDVVLLDNLSQGSETDSSPYDSMADD
ncbi:hypothetical protein BB560_006214 [Smittium megazygosporum]|uniref:Uncharacterized protein n=1 Tax=Smittium megazygosporum TaxID=133381 RepID=A0A2T9YD44_9FUNG|nr:hypothetical protein BB560_006214 [Smittium megazygosporum]